MVDGCKVMCGGPTLKIYGHEELLLMKNEYKLEYFELEY